MHFKDTAGVRLKVRGLLNKLSQQLKQLSKSSSHLKVTNLSLNKFFKLDSLFGMLSPRTFNRTHTAASRIEQKTVKIYTAREHNLNLLLVLSQSVYFGKKLY